MTRVAAAAAGRDAEVRPHLQGRLQDRFPLLGHRFSVSIGPPALGRKGQPVLAFHRVDLPLLATETGEGPAPCLVLHRAADADTRLHDWWARAAQGRAPLRTVTVRVLDAEGQPSGLGWRYTGCLPLTLSCTALDAQQPAVVVERLALRFQACTRLD